MNRKDIYNYLQQALTLKDYDDYTLVTEKIFKCIPFDSQVLSLDKINLADTGRIMIRNVRIEIKFIKPDSNFETDILINPYINGTERTMYYKSRAERFQAKLLKLGEKVDE